MTSRERVIGAIKRTPIDRIPKYDIFWEDTLEKYINAGLILPETKKIVINGQDKVINKPIDEYFNFDIVQLYMDISMRFETCIVDETEDKITISDRCGYTAQKFKGRASSMHFVDHKIKNKEDWEKYKHRLIFNKNDTSRVDNENYYLRMKEYPSWDGFKQIFDEYLKLNKFITAFVYGPFEATWRHHGYEESLMDLLLEPEMMKDMFDKATTLLIDTVKHMISIGTKPDAIWLCEDMGATHTTLFSLATYQECLFPYHKKIGDFLHENGIYYFMHSCGKIESFIPSLIDAGLDVIQALQANTGMNVVDLKKKYGDKLTFFGNIGEVSFKDGKEAIENELRSKIPIAKKNGGYIYHSDHSIPPEVELDTYLHAMKILEEIGKY